MLTISLILVFLGYITYFFYNFNRSRIIINRFPGPKTDFLFGNILRLGLNPADYLSYIRKWCKDYNFKAYRLWAGPQPYVIFSNPEDVEFILSSNKLTFKADTYDFIRPWLGNGLLTSSGQYWTKHRKMITPSFHFQILQDFLHIINETTDRFMDLLETYAERGDKFDFQDVVKRSTMDVICETAMGTRVNTIEGNISPIVNAMDDLCYIIVERIFSILKRPIMLFFFHPMYWRQRRALNVMRQELAKIIDARRETLNELKKRDNNHKDEYKRPKMAFLDNLLTSQVDGKYLTFQQVFEEVSTFMFEGHDTTAVCITFTIFCLSRHPEIQEKVFNEQLKIFGNDKKRSPTYQELQDMKYLELVIKESLRLFPSVPMITRTPQEDTEIGGGIVPKGTTVVITLMSVGTNEKYFDEPFVFRPERFDVDKRINSNPFDYVPFSAGPRNCVGQKFAMMELKVTISKIIRNFQCLPPASGLSLGLNDPAKNIDKPEYRFDPILAVLVTLKSVNGVYIKLRKRNY